MNELETSQVQHLIRDRDSARAELAALRQAIEDPPTWKGAAEFRDPTDPNWFPVQSIVRVRGIASDMRACMAEPGDFPEGTAHALLVDLIETIWPAEHRPELVARALAAAQDTSPQFRVEPLLDSYHAAAIYERDKWRAEHDQHSALRGRIETLAEAWRYNGEFGWGRWQEGEGPDHEGYILDQCARDIRAALAGATPAEEADHRARAGAGESLNSLNDTIVRGDR